MIARVIALELTAWRKQHGLTQAQAADRLGVPRASYVAWEEGKPCRISALIENAIGVPVAKTVLGR